MPNIDHPPDSTTPRTQCVAYGAKSTADPRGSIATQLSDCRAAIEREGGVVAAEFTDENKSAWSGNRGDGLASAKEKAAALAATHGGAELWVQHSDRLARGDGLKADHLVEVYFSTRRAGVRLRSVQDDNNLEDVLRAALVGERNSEDSDRKSQAVRDGMRRSRERADAAWLFRGIKPDGYECIRGFDGGRVIHAAIKCPERGHIFELMWEMARAGQSAQAIQLEFSARGFMTAPVRTGYKPRPFDVHRINQALANPVYAGLVTHKGEVIGAGDWPRYVEPEDFARLQNERRERASATKHGRGRPVIGYVLSELATCGECGGRAQAATYGKRCADGSPKRTYVCNAHREYHRDSAEWCAAMPFDATEVDRLVLSGMDTLLADADTLRAQLNAGRVAEIERMGRITTSAREEAAKADAVAVKAQERFERALAEDDGDAAEIAMTAVKRKRDEARKARLRLDAALDALRRDDQAEDADVMAQVWEALSGRVREADGMVRKLNAALREWFEAFELHREDDGEIRVVPMLSAIAVARILRDPEPWTPGAEKQFTVEVPRSQAGDVTAALMDGTITVDVSGPDALSTKSAISSKNSHCSTCAGSKRSSGRYSVPSAK